MKPGEDLIEQGVADLKDGIESVPSLLVSIGAHRLRGARIQVPASTFPSPEHRLYLLLSKMYDVEAHSKYNSFIRRLVSFERAAECGI